jgi:hypothetical protein
LIARRSSHRLELAPKRTTFAPQLKPSQQVRRLFSARSRHRADRLANHTASFHYLVIPVQHPAEHIALG